MGKEFRMVDGRVKLVKVDGCANCGNTAGRFRVVDGKRYCIPKCARPDKSPDRAKNLWNFKTMNIDSDPNKGPVTVTSLNHLRQLEKEHGVCSVAANYETKNWERRG